METKLFVDPTVPQQPLCMSEFSLTSALINFDRLNPRVVLEVGTARGGTFYQWMKHAAPGAIFVSVDLPEVVPYYGDVEPLNLREDWVKYGQEHGHTVHVVEANSTYPETIARVKEICPVVDWLFIDGGHDLPTVTSDWQNYSPLVRPGGIVGMHDVLARGVASSQVDQLWDKIKLTNKTVAFGDPNGDAGIGLVFM